MSDVDNMDDDRRDRLISRVIDGEASGSDWSALRAMASADPGVWAELAQTQRQHEALSGVLDEISAIAEGVEIPEGELMTPTERFERRMAGVRAWGGWAAAAAILLVWFTGLPTPIATDFGQNFVQQNGPHTGRASLGPRVVQGPQSPESAWQHYLDTGRDAGRVLGEVPGRTVLETRPVAGGMEVVYLRQVVERELVEPGRVYRLGRDEFGQAALRPEPTAELRRVSY